MSVISHVDPSSSSVNESSTIPESRTARSATKVDALVSSMLQEALTLADQWDQQKETESGCSNYTPKNFQGFGYYIKKKVAVALCLEDLDAAIKLVCESDLGNEPASSYLDFIHEYLREGLRQGKPINIDKIIKLITPKEENSFSGVRLYPYLPPHIIAITDRKHHLPTFLKYIRSITAQPLLLRHAVGDFVLNNTIGPDEIPNYLFYCSRGVILRKINHFLETRDSRSLIKTLEFVISIPLKYKIISEFTHKNFDCEEETGLGDLFLDRSHYFFGLHQHPNFVEECLARLPIEILESLQKHFHGLFDLQAIHSHVLEILRERDPKSVAYFEENLGTVSFWRATKDPNNVHVRETVTMVASQYPTILWGDSLKAFMASFAENNPEIAIDLASALEAVWIELKGFILSSYLAKVAEKDPNKALELAKSIEDSKQRLLGCTIVGKIIAKQNPKLAAETLKFIKKSFQPEDYPPFSSFFYDIAGQIAEVDSQLALELIEPIRKDPERLKGYITDFAQSDPKTALVLMREALSPDPKQWSYSDRGVVSSVATAYAAIDLTEAMRITDSLKIDPGGDIQHSETYSAVVSRALKSNPAAIVAYERRLDPNQRDGFIASTLQAPDLRLLLDNHFNTIIELISDIQDLELRYQTLAEFAVIVGPKKPQCAYELLRNTANKQGKHRIVHAERLAEAIVETDPEIAFEVLQKCDYSFQFISPGTFDVLERIGEILASRGLSQAPSLIKKYSEHRLRYLMIGAMLVKLAEMHGSGSIPLLLVLDNEEPTAKEFIYEKMIKHIVRKDLTATQILAESIKDPECRESAMLRIARVVAQTDFFAAEKIVRGFSSLYLKAKGLVVLSRQVHLLGKIPSSEDLLK